MTVFTNYLEFNFFSAKYRKKSVREQKDNESYRNKSRTAIMNNRFSQIDFNEQIYWIRTMLEDRCYPNLRIVWLLDNAQHYVRFMWCFLPLSYNSLYKLLDMFSFCILFYFFLRQLNLVNIYIVLCIYSYFQSASTLLSCFKKKCCIILLCHVNRTHYLSWLYITNTKMMTAYTYSNSS